MSASTVSRVAAAYAKHFPDFSSSGLNSSWQGLHIGDIGDVMAAQSGWDASLDSLVDLSDELVETTHTDAHPAISRLRRGPLCMAAFRLCQESDHASLRRGIALYRLIDQMWSLQSVNENFRVSHVDALIRSGDHTQATTELRRHHWTDSHTHERLFLAATNPFVSDNAASIPQSRWLSRFNAALSLTHDLVAVNVAPTPGAPFERLRARPHHSAEGSLVSVVLPVPPHMTRLGNIVQAIRNQTWASWELLLIDTGSCPELTAECRALSSRDARIRVVHASEDQGYYASLNLGMANARGDFIAVQDPCTWPHPELLERQVHYLSGAAQQNVCSSHALRTRTDLSPLGHTALPDQHGVLMFRRSNLPRFGFFDACRVGAFSEYRARLQRLTGTRIPTADGAVSIKHDQTLGSGGHVPDSPKDPRSTLYIAGYTRRHATAGGTLAAPLNKVADRFVARTRLPHPPPQEQLTLDVALVADLRSHTPSVQALYAIAIHLHRSGMAVGVSHYPGLANALPDETIADRVLDLIETDTCVPAQLNEAWKIHHTLVLDPALLQFRPAWPARWRTSILTLLETPIPEAEWPHRSDLWDPQICDAHAMELFGQTPHRVPSVLAAARAALQLPEAPLEVN